MAQCHKCPYNGTGSKACLACQYTEPSNKNLVHSDYLENFEYIQETSYRVTHLSEDDEDTLRQGLIELFNLKPLELLMIQAIMNGKTLTEYAKLIEKLSLKNRECSREHAFQIRKSILKKIPRFQNVLLTKGQRKQLKK